MLTFQAYLFQPSPMQINLPPATPPTVPWQTTATATGTLLAVIVAVTVAVVETARARKARGEADAAKKNQEDREHREAASRVAGWVEEEYYPDRKGSVYIRKATAYIANNGDEPVFTVSASVGVGLRAFRSLGPLAIPHIIPTLPPGRTLSWDLTIPLLAHDDTEQPGLELRFTDPRGYRWNRNYDGTLMETTGQQSALFNSDDVEGITGQLGRPGALNPMSVTIDFVNALTCDPPNLDKLRQVLAPEAVGWKSVQPEALEAMQEELGRYGIAGHVHYPAPHVAYVKIVAQEHEHAQVVAGDMLEIEAKIVVLTYVRHRGWRVFGYGAPPPPPDTIKFPKSSLVDDDQVPPYSD